MRSFPPDGVNPTARWIARAFWKGALAIVLFLLVAAVVDALR